MMDVLERKINQLNDAIQNIYHLNQQNIDQLRDEFNATIQIMETNIGNYIASNDFTLKAINQTLQYVVKTPLVIVVPSSDEIDDHRGEVFKYSVIDLILYLDQTEKLISQDNTVENLNQQNSRRRFEGEPSFEPDIFPTCGNGETFDCEEIKSDEVLDKNCTGILKFSSGTSSCSCRGSNDSKRNAKNILKEGWSQFTR